MGCEKNKAAKKNYSLCIRQKEREGPDYSPTELTSMFNQNYDFDEFKKK